MQTAKILPYHLKHFTNSIHTSPYLTTGVKNELIKNFNDSYNSFDNIFND